MERAFYHAGHLAFNVKTHSLRFAEGQGTDAQREQAWEVTSEEWWQRADELAREHGFDGVYSAGRSSGWLQPYPYLDKGETTDNEERVSAFEKELGELLADAPEIFADELAHIMECDAEIAEQENRARAKREAIESATAACLATLSDLIEYAKDSTLEHDPYPPCVADAVAAIAASSAAKAMP